MVPEKHLFPSLFSWKPLVLQAGGHAQERRQRTPTAPACRVLLLLVLSLLAVAVPRRPRCPDLPQKRSTREAGTSDGLKMGIVLVGNLGGAKR